MLAHLLFCRGQPFDEIPLYTCRDASTNHPFLCKTNPILSAVGGLQMNISYVKTTNYEQKTMNYANNKQTQFPKKSNERKY